MTLSSNSKTYDVIVVGGGAAGVGVSIALLHAGIENFIVLEKYFVGASFACWPAETRFITPSFPSNSIGMLDLNSIAIGVSPAYSINVEHPTGREYAAHLKGVAAHFMVPVQDKTEVLRVSKFGDGFRVDTSEDTLSAKHVIWAAGEFQYPSIKGVEGSELCRHTAMIADYKSLEGDEFTIIGGYESGVDAAYHLSSYGKRVRLIDRGCPWKEESSDPSVALSTYSQERMRADWFRERVELLPNKQVSSVTASGGSYAVKTEDGSEFRSNTQPLFAGGFAGSHQMVSDLFEMREDGFPLLNDHDESTIVPGMFLCGPAVRHKNLVFCFIFKYRQRFAVVAKAIATSLGLPAEQLELYRHWGMYLDDLSCCGEECSTC
ncbi:MAG: NAD(P)/FAD-dependent oxidoreductase [Planctomycetota bacterium]